MARVPVTPVFSYDFPSSMEVILENIAKGKAEWGSRKNNDFFEIYLMIRNYIQKIVDDVGDFGSGEVIVNIYT